MIVFALAACTRTSEKYCGLHPEDLANCPPSDAARQTCSADPECPAMVPHCKLEGATGECVECFDDAQCIGVGKLACDPDTLSCRSCVEHADCASLACTPEGACADDAIYVAAGGSDGGTCVIGAPCRTIKYALGQVSATRYYLKLSGQLVESVTIDGKRVVILADPGTTLAGNPALRIVKGTVSIDGLELSCTDNMGAVRSEMESTTQLRDVLVHDCGGMEPAIESKGGYLAVTRGRIVDNAGGGIATDAGTVFSITNSIIARNGSASAKKGGVTLGAATQGLNNRFEHNTVVENRVKPGAAVAGGVTCALTNALPAPNNIVAGNTPGSTIGCDFTGSKTADDLATWLFTPDYHLMAGSPAIDKVDSTIDDDVDGQFRPQGVRGDYGADEYKP